MQNSPKSKLVRCIDDLMMYRGLVGSNGLPKDLILSITNFHAKGDYRELIHQIRIFFRINCNLGIGFSPSEKNPDYLIQDAIMRSMGNYFDPVFFFQAANIDHKKRKEPAKITFPNPTPPLNSRPFETMRTYVIVERWAFMLPLESIMFLVAHELAHILLYSTQNCYRKSEKATDILAAILIGPDIAKNGARANNISLGYLNDEQLEITCNRIKEKEKISRFSRIKNMAINAFNNF